MDFSFGAQVKVGGHSDSLKRTPDSIKNGTRRPFLNTYGKSISIYFETDDQ